MKTIKPFLLFFENIMKNIPTLCIAVLAITGLYAYEGTVQIDSLPDLAIVLSAIFAVFHLVSYFLIRGINFEGIVFTITSWLSSGIIAAVLFDYAGNHSTGVFVAVLAAACLVIGRIINIITSTLLEKGHIETDRYEIRFMTQDPEQFEKVKEFIDKTKNPDDEPLD